MTSTVVQAFIVGASLALGCVDAFAQSSVNISGTLRVAVAHGNGGTTPLYGSGGGKGSSLNDHLSNFNITGKEDLGDGMYAAVDLQHFLQADTGMPWNLTANTFWDGRSRVRLGGAFGEVYLGRDYAPVFWTTLFADPWLWDASAAQIGIVQWANYLTTSGIRTNNTLGYTSPKLSGFTAQAAVSLAEGAPAGRAVGANLAYAEGPLWISAGFDQHRNAGGGNDRLASIAAAYDFGAVRPIVLYSSSKVAGVSYSALQLALTAPLGNGTLKSAIGRLSDWDTATAGKQSLTKVSLGYLYNLSKRSNVFGAVANARSNGTSTTTALEVGMAHSF